MRQTLGNPPRAYSVASKDQKRSQCGITSPYPVVSGAQPDETLSMLAGLFSDLQSKPNEVWCRRDTMMNSSTIEKQTIHSICTNELFLVLNSSTEGMMWSSVKIGNPFASL